jgi:hypothetical protein
VLEHYGTGRHTVRGFGTPHTNRRPSTVIEKAQASSDLCTDAELRSWNSALACQWFPGSAGLSTPDCLPPASSRPMTVALRPLLVRFPGPAPPRRSSISPRLDKLLVHREACSTSRQGPTTDSSLVAHGCVSAARYV